MTKEIAVIVPKLRKLIPRLASNHAGEIVATAEAIGRVLKSGGHDWHDLTAALCASPPTTAEIESDWRGILRFCARNVPRLTERELNFIASIAQWRRPTLTKKQDQWLRDIAARLTEEQ